ncbi:hypothetical protein VTO42DRAFT_6764 [Malbranchea cinnamomea]
MRTKKTGLVIFIGLFVSIVSAGYTLVDEYSGGALFSEFTFFTGPDPTEGFVKYLSESEARDAGLISVIQGYDGEPVAYIGVDYTNEAPEGRPSVRISSSKTYNKGLFIADFTHVPSATCGTWPAFWMLGPNWPHGGEIDIYEGINLQNVNSMALHTGPDCSISRELSTHTGMIVTENCDVNAPEQPFNKGCQVLSNDPASFADGLNAIGGGMFATEWTDDGISIWFFSRQSGIPSDIENGIPDPSQWGLPEAMFKGASCNFTKSFVDLGFVLDTTFCGQWAGQKWSTSQCAAKRATCEEFVKHSPEAFRESYWEVKSLKVYQVGVF